MKLTDSINNDRETILEAEGEVGAIYNQPENRLYGYPRHIPQPPTQLQRQEKIKRLPTKIEKSRTYLSKILVLPQKNGRDQLTEPVEGMFPSIT